MAAEVEHGDFAATGEHRINIVLNHDRRDLPLAHEIAQMLEQMQRFRRRKARAWLVQQQQIRAADQGQCNVHPALHAVGDTAGLLVEITGEIHHLDHVVELGIAEMLRNQMKLFMHGEILEDAGALERARHALPAPPGHRAPRDILVTIANGSRDRTATAAHRVEQRGFAGQFHDRREGCRRQGLPDRRRTTRGPIHSSRKGCSILSMSGCLPPAAELLQPRHARQSADDATRKHDDEHDDGDPGQKLRQPARAEFILCKGERSRRPGAVPRSRRCRP